MPHLVYLPHLNRSIEVGTRKYMRGRGMGSVLLNKGGAGGASSYESVGEYTETTGVNPYASGRGLGSISKKLESLSIAPKKRKEKNINFNL